MMRDRLTHSLSVLPVVLAMILLTCCQVQADENRPPNILFLFTDDQPQSCLGCLGNEHIQTPNLDRLADEGRLFTNAFVTTAICCSSRASILTGQHMRRHGIEDFQTPLSAEAFAQTYPGVAPGLRLSNRLPGKVRHR